MIPLNFQPGTGENLNLLSVDSTLQLAQGKSNAQPVETSFSSLLEQAAEADSTDGNNQTQEITQPENPTEVVVEQSAEPVTAEVTDESLVAFENQMARIAELPALEPFSMEISFDEEGELYSGVQIAFTTPEENDFDAEIDRLLGFSEEKEEPVAETDIFPVMQENQTAAIVLPSQPVLQQNSNTPQKTELNEERVSALQTEKKSVKAKKSGTVMDAISVVDERTPELADETKTVTMTSFDGKDSAEMSLNLGQKAAEQFAQDNQTGAYTGNIEAGLTRTDFASMVSDEIKSNAGEFVKTGSIVLQNNNKGSINLILQPEQLGNVKIHLELSDNQITGKIVVATKEAYDAFKQSMNDLKQAFIASGFDTNGFDLTWAGSQGSSQQGNPENQDRIYENLNAAVARHSSDRYLDNMPDDLGEGVGSTTYINLVA